MSKQPTTIPKTYRITRLLPKGYEWIVVTDKSGCFTGRIFRASDISCTNDRSFVIGWPDQIVFQHIYTIEYRTIKKGLVEVGFLLTGECQEAVTLYHAWTRSTKKQAALQKLRLHISHCACCKASIRNFVQIERGYSDD